MLVINYKNEFRFYLGGKVEKYVKRLREDFINLVDSFYGPINQKNLSNEIDEAKKNSESVYDIAISYSSKQKEYVTEVAENLEMSGIKIFFAPFKENEMWGEKLDLYLDETFFSKAKFCIMFISRDYIEIEWCNKEASAAFNRQSEMGTYILPVRFDDTQLIGLSPNIAFLTTKDNNPKELSLKVIRKLRSCNLQ